MIGKGAQAAGVVADVNDASGPLPARLSLADAQALAWRLFANIPADADGTVSTAAFLREVASANRFGRTP